MEPARMPNQLMPARNTIEATAHGRASLTSTPIAAALYCTNTVATAARLPE